MAKIYFKVSSRAGKLLGRENFSNPEGAIIELVKNSYDADAKNCVVVFDINYKTIINKIKKTRKKVIDNKTSHIFIIDNGEGMTDTVINKQWMQIGTGNKEFNSISNKTRIKTGSKGIGRFALDRLGTISEMWTHSKDEKDNIGFYWKMNWNQFDNSDKSISEIEADLIKNSTNQNNILSKNLSNSNTINDFISNIDFNIGTILKISNLKDDWFNKDIESVFKNLEALIPPKELKIPFDVYFHHIQQAKEFGKVETAFFDDYDYKVFAKYNANTLNVDFKITRNELDVELIKKKYLFLHKKRKSPYDFKTIEKKTFYYSKNIDSILKWNLDDENTKLLKDVGSFNLTFYYLKYSVSKKEGYPFKSINTKERRSVLDKFGGMKIYRDSFRVRPYGDSGNDWLKLGARVAQSPAGAGQRIGDWRVRPEQTAGIITISRKINPLLKDKSDRGALQENNSFETFKNIIIGVIHEFELDRTKILNPYFLYKKEVAERIQEELIQIRAEELADKIIGERKKAEQKYYGKKFNEIDLFKQKMEEEEKKSYERTFKDTFRKMEEEFLSKEYDEIVQVRALASLGLVVSSFAHELKEIRNNSTEIKSLKKIFISLISENKKKLEEYRDGIDILELLNENSKKIKHWINYSLTAIKKDKRKRKDLNLTSFFKKTDKTWMKIFKSKGIKFTIIDKIEDLDYFFRAFEMDMNTIFTNLINNSIDSFSNLTIIQERNILISVELTKNTIEIIYSDDGTGLSNVFQDKEEIFLPFTTTKKDSKGEEIGTGLGMYLVKNVIADNNGSIIILEPKKGFSVKILLPIRRILNEERNI